MAWNNPAALLEQWRAERQAGTTDKSAAMADIRDAVGEGLKTSLPAPPGQPPLTTAFGHQPGVISVSYPFAGSLWETGFVPTTNYSATDGADAEGYADWGGAEGEQAATLAVFVAVMAMGPDTPKLQAAAEAWEPSLVAWVKDNPTFNGTVEVAEYGGFSMEAWPWGEAVHYCAVARVRVTIIR